MQVYELKCSSPSLHEVPRACMQFHELECSFMSLYAVPFFVWAAHKNFAVLVLIEKEPLKLLWLEIDWFVMYLPNPKAIWIPVQWLPPLMVNPRFPFLGKLGGIIVVLVQGNPVAKLLVVSKKITLLKFELGQFSGINPLTPGVPALTTSMAHTTQLDKNYYIYHSSLRRAK